MSGQQALGFHRLLFVGAEVDDAFIDRVADDVLSPLRAEAVGPQIY